MNSIDILALSEMKTDASVHPSLYTLNGFHDPIIKARNRKGGGTAVYVRNHMAFRHLPDLESSEFETCWVKIQVNKACIVVCSCYLPPNANSEGHDSFLEYLADCIVEAQIHNPDILVVAGDINGGNCWLAPDAPHHSPVSPFETKLKDVTETLSLTQLIDSATRIQGTTHNLRDIIFINDPQVVIQSGVLPSFSNLDHIPVFASLAVPSHKPSAQTPTPVYDYANTNIEQLVNSLAHTDWHTITEKGVDDAIEELTSTVLNAANKCIPVKLVRKTDSKPWVSSELRREMRKRDRLFHVARKTGHDDDWARWKKQRNFVTKLNRDLKRDKRAEKLDILLQNKKDPYKYHTILKDIAGLKRKDQMPPLISDDKILSDETIKANAFNAYFCEQTNINIENSHLSSLRDYSAKQAKTQHVFTYTDITPQEVLSCINKLDSSKACGPDKIPTKVLKMAAVYIAEPLAVIFNKSLREGRYPAKWKEATVKPIYKGKGSPSDITSYRPISLLPCISKVFEKLMFARIYEHISTHGLLNQRQSGYRPGHNTQLQLIYLSDMLYQSLDRGDDFTIIYLDISRYFEKIWHDGLLAKCQTEFGITGSNIKWLQSYLEGRTQAVQLGQQISQYRRLNAGVPQGSVLGPLLAIMYLNSLGDITENEMLFFADDSSIFTNHNIENKRAAEDSLQKDLDAIHEYGNRWIITFNACKTSQQTFSHKRAPDVPSLQFGTQKIPIDDYHKHLGLYISTDLRFKHHVNEVLLKFNRALSPLYPIASEVPRNVLLTIYKIYVQPHLDYCASVYDGHITDFDRSRLEKAQNRAARLITNTPRRTSTAGLLKELGWSTLANRRQSQKLLLYQKLRFDSFVPAYITDIIPNTRMQDTVRELRSTQNDTITEPPVQRDSYGRSFIPSATKQWNKLSIELRRTADNPVQFKKHLLRAIGPKTANSYFTMGSKRGNMLHTRLRLGSSQLRVHLFKRGKVDSPRCSCGFIREDTSHFILVCPKYSLPRTRLFEKMSNILGLRFHTLPKTHKIKCLIEGPEGDAHTKAAVATATQTFLLETEQIQRMVAHG